MNKIKYLFLTLLLIITACNVYAKDIKGSIENIDLKNNKVTINVNNKNNTYIVTSSTKLMRGLIGTELLEVNLISLSAGDAIECSVDDKDVITKANITFNIIRGTIKSIDKNTLTLTDNTKLVVAEKASISIENGGPGKITDLVPGHTFVARTNPNTGVIWTLVVSGKENIKTDTKTTPNKTETQTTEIKQPEVKNTDKSSQETKSNDTTIEVVTPKTNTVDISIDSVELSAPNNMVSGDMILIQVIASPHCGASADIQYVQNTKVKLTEDKPGVYTGFITIPDKNLNNAKILAYLSNNGKNISKVCDTVLTVQNKSASLKNVIVKEVENKDENLSNNNTVKNDNNTKTTDVENNDTNNVENKSEDTQDNTSLEVKGLEKKESEQNNDSKDDVDKNTNKDSIINPLKEVATIKIDDIKIVNPQNGATVKDIQVSGIAIPNTTINVKTIYTNGKYGVLSISGILNEDIITVNEDGVFNYGPIELKNFFATPGLIYYIELQYTEQPQQSPKVIKVIRE